MSHPRALLTGRSGFTGRYVAEQLQAAGYEVFGLGEQPATTESSSIPVNLLDRQAVCDAVAAVKPDVVLHLAAITFVAHGDADEIYRVNVVGTRNLLDALAQLPTPPKLVLLASSANIYGNADVDPIDESTPPSPANDYAVSKLAMEYMAQLWAPKLPIVITRPFNYTGVGQSEQFLIPKIVSHFRRGERLIELGNTQVIRDFGDVRDVAEIYASLVRTKPVNNVFNVCTGIGHSLGDVLQIMSELAGYEIEVRVNPNFVRANEVTRLVGSNDHLLKIGGVGPPRTLRDTLAWMYTAP